MNIMRKLLLILTITAISSVQGMYRQALRQAPAAFKAGARQFGTELAPSLRHAGRSTVPLGQAGIGLGGAYSLRHLYNQSLAAKQEFPTPDKVNQLLATQLAAQPQAIEKSMQLKREQVAREQAAVAQTESDKYLLAEQNLELRLGQELAAEEAARYQIYLELNQPGRFGQMLESAKDQWKRVPSYADARQFMGTHIKRVPGYETGIDYGQRRLSTLQEYLPTRLQLGKLA